MTVIGYAVKTGVVAGCAWCMENFDKEPVWCSLLCGASSLIGIKITYSSAKICYQRYSPLIRSSVKLVSNYVLGPVSNSTSLGYCDAIF